MQAMDYAADVAKYTTNVNAKAVETIVKYCGIALRNADSSLVSATDPAELGRVRVGFAAKKLGLTPEEADKGMKVVIEKMKADRTKSRVTFYYLLAEATNTMSKLA
jgi:energy-coupling factor transporter ATP-binding protein EcfA2